MGSFCDHVRAFSLLRVHFEHAQGPTLRLGRFAKRCLEVFQQCQNLWTDLYDILSDGHALLLPGLLDAFELLGEVHGVLGIDNGEQEVPVDVLLAIRVRVGEMVQDIWFQRCVLEDFCSGQLLVPRNPNLANIIQSKDLLLPGQDGSEVLHRTEALLWKEQLACANDTCQLNGFGALPLTPSA